MYSSGNDTDRANAEGANLETIVEENDRSSDEEGEDKSSGDIEEVIRPSPGE